MTIKENSNKRLFISCVIGMICFIVGPALILLGIISGIGDHNIPLAFLIPIGFLFILFSLISLIFYIFSLKKMRGKTDNKKNADRV